MKQAAKIRLYEAFQKLRSWLDNEIYICPTFRKKSDSDKFAEKIRREMEKTMSREKFCYEEGKTLIPTRYTVLISEEDSAQWYGTKLFNLQAMLDHYVKIKLKAVSQDSFDQQFVYIRAEQRIKAGEVRVIHQWAENEAPVEIIFSNHNFSVRASEYIEGEYETLLTSI